MKKPSPEPKEITKDDRSIIEEGVYVTPEDLRRLAGEMEEEGILSFNIQVEGYEGWFGTYYKTMETDSEAKARYTLECRQYDDYIKKQKDKKIKQIERLKKEAEKLGLKIS